MTLKIIADAARTSVATVSKAFAGSKEISEKTKDRIFRVAKELGCFDKYYKAPRKQPLIAIMIPEIDSECYGNYASVFERELNRRGADTIVACTRFNAEREARLFRELAYGLKVDGVLLWGTGKEIKNNDEVPLLIFESNRYDNINADVVTVEIHSSMLELIKTVKDYGHKSVGFFGERLTVSKRESFKKAMRKVGLPIRDNLVIDSEKRFAAAGEDCMRAIIEGGELPSVIVTAYDQIAYGAMKYAREMGYRIPEDISFVGMDDITAAPYFDIPLSSIHVGYELVCEKICNLIFEKMENRHVRMKERIFVPVSLNIRESLKNLKQENI